jgi:hypothetical protein
MYTETALEEVHKIHLAQYRAHRGAVVKTVMPFGFLKRWKFID